MNGYLKDNGLNSQWLLQNAGAPIKYNLEKNAEDAGRLLQNEEAAAWFARLAERAETDEIGAIHGSHDYRMENILGKCWILGFSINIRPFADKMEFILRYLDKRVGETPPEELSFSKIYHYRDCEKVLACFLPFLGYRDDPAVLHIARERLDILYSFTRQKRYDIYAGGSKLKGVKKEWQPYIISPDLYADGHIALPDTHDFILFAGMMPYFGAEEKEKAETVAAWLFGGGYSGVIRRYGYFYVPGGSYNAKAVIFKLHLPDFHNMEADGGGYDSLVFNAFVLSHFKSAREADWFSSALRYLEQYRNENGRYRFPPRMIAERPDSYVIFGGHMNAGENRKSKLYGEILSTYWMERTYRNLA